MTATQPAQSNSSISAYQDLYQNFTLALTGATKTVTVEVDSNILKTLKDSGYSLCFAKKVGDTYNVVWSSSTGFLSNNDFSWQPQYQLFGTNTFQAAVVVKATTNTQNIQLGQISVLDKEGVLEAPKSGGPSTSISMNNQYGSIHPGVNQLATDLNGNLVSSAIYVAENAVVTGTINLTPKESVLVWFEQDIETGTMFSDARSNSCEIDMTNTNSQTVLYNDSQEWVVV